MHAKAILAMTLAASAAAAHPQDPLDDRESPWNASDRARSENSTTAASVEHPDGTSRYSYFHFKEQRPFALDTARIAVLRGADPDLSRLGVDISAASPMAVRGWWFLETAPWARTVGEVENSVSAIARGGGAEFVSPVFLDDRGEPVVITPDLLVGLDRDLDPSRAEEILVRSGAGTIVDRDWANMKRVYRLKSSARNGFEVLAAANELARRPEVTFAEPDMLATGHTALIPDDTYFPFLWALHNDGTFGLPCTEMGFDLDAPEAWDFTIGNASVLVEVLDSGVQLDHPDLNLYLPGFDPTGDDGGGGPVNVCDNHGTPVAGCVSGIINNTLGIVGVAPGVKVAPARTVVSNLTCDNSGVIASSWVVDALAHAEAIGARITNSSWFRNSASSAIDQKFADTRANGMVHFASAGNDGLASIHYPASLSTVNAVAALEPCGGRAPFSNYGVGLAFSAPGHYGISTDRTGPDGYNDGMGDGGCLPSGTLGCDSDADCPPGDTCLLVTEDYALVAGTSFASPYTAGVAALVLSVNRNLTADQVESVLQQSAVDLGDPGYDTVYGWGFVNAYNAVQLAVAISGTPGEATELKVTGFDPTTGSLDLSYLPGCASSSHDVYYGPLDDVSTYGWSGSTCGIGNTGRYSGFHPGSDSYFFVLVGNAGDDEGPYGTGDPGPERPAAGSAWCGRTQQLDTACPGG